MTDPSLTRSQAQGSDALHLTPETFEWVYNTIVSLKFPVDVARVLELRYLINHAADAFPEPAATADYREFREALQTVVDETGIENKRHSERMLRILSMMRELHYAYSINQRDAENKLRARMAHNRAQRERAIRHATGFIIATALCSILWLVSDNPDWPVKIMTAGFVIGTWLHVRTVPMLDRGLRLLEKRMSRSQRHRVKSIHWRLLALKLALVLGFKRNSEVEVFRIETDHDLGRPWRLTH
ncbi:MAG: hypothetical protein ACJ8KA_07930 [Sulfurifustis sp.]|jgi:hypothetical protein